MRISAQDLQCCGDTVRVHGPQGDVLLEQRRNNIIAHYLGGQLVNGSALAYAEKTKQAVLELAEKHPFPWHKKKDGSLRINNHRDFYAQTFDPSLAGIERIGLWNSENKEEPRQHEPDQR